MNENTISYAYVPMFACVRVCVIARTHTRARSKFYERGYVSLCVCVNDLGYLYFTFTNIRQIYGHR